MQVFSCESELKVFLEFDRIVESNSRNILYYDTPKSYTDGHDQYILTFDKNGLKNETEIARISNMDGITFHPNISMIFRYQKRFFIFSGESMYYKKSLFVWDERIKAFKLLSSSQANELFPEWTSLNNASEEYLNNITKKSGCSKPLAETTMKDTVIQWGDKQLEMKVYPGKEFIKLEFSSKGNVLHSMTIKRRYQEKISSKERKALPVEEYGHEKL